MLETLGAEGGLLAQFDDLAFEAGGSLVGAVPGAAGAFGQRGRLAGDVAAKPFADGVAGAAELTGRGLDAMLAGEGDEFLMEPMKVGLHAIEFKAGAVHAGMMTSLVHDLPSLSQGLQSLLLPCAPRHPESSPL